MNILYLMSSANIFGGTPKKTLDLIKHGDFNSSIYFWSDAYKEYHSKFEEAGASVYMGGHGRNIFKHIRKILHIIDKEDIDLVQTQFTRGEVLGFLIKLLRPKVMLIVAFVTPFKPSVFKTLIVKFAYHKVNACVFVSKYVKQNKVAQFPILKSKVNNIIYNGTLPRKGNGKEVVSMKHTAILDIAGLTELKNIQILVEAFNIIVNNYRKNDIHLYIAGDGPYRNTLETMIEKYFLNRNIFLLGYQSNVGGLLKTCDVFVHPSYAEGFGIAVAEAMHAVKPIIVSSAGALPELIKDKKSGLIVDPYIAEEWAEAILKLIENPDMSSRLAKSAKYRAESKFSVYSFQKNYEQLYRSILSEK